MNSVVESRRLAGGVIVGLALAIGTAAAAGAKLQTENEKWSYTVGIDVGSDLKKVQGFNLKVMMASLKKALAGDPPKLADDQRDELKRRVAGALNDNKPIAPADAEQFSDVIGYEIGRSMKPIEKHVDLPAFRSGVGDALEGREPQLAETDREAVKSAVGTKLRAEQMQARAASAAANKEKGAKYLAENGKRKGVVTTKTGLQYESITEGKGATPTAADKVTVHYRGTLIDGTEFDSSYKRNEPITFPLGNVIPGWTEGLQLMKEGGKAKLYIPSDLGYGERGAGAAIGPNETLVFEVELLKVERGAPQ